MSSDLSQTLVASTINASVTAQTPPPFENLRDSQPTPNEPSSGKWPTGSQTSPARTHLTAFFLALPFSAFLLLALISPTFDRHAILILITLPLVYIARQIYTEQYRPENTLVVATGAITLTLAFLVPLLVPALTQLQQQLVSCAAPLGWAVLFSLIFLNFQKSDLSPCRAPLLIASALVGIAICLSIWYAGGSRFVLLQPLKLPVTDRFPYTFKIWDTHPWWEHYFLTFDKGYYPFEQRQCYRGYSPLYAFSNYAFLRVARWYTGLDYLNLMRLVPFFTGALGSFFVSGSLMWAFRCSLETRVRFLFLVISSTAFLLLIPDFWTAHLAYRPDNTFPFQSLFHLVLAVAVVNASVNRNLAGCLLAAALLVATGFFLPHFGLILGISLLFFWPSQNRKFFFWCAVLILGASCLTLGGIYVLAKLAGDVSVKGAPILIRMGFIDPPGLEKLNPIKAVLFPENQFMFRVYSFVIVGALAAIASAGLQMLCCRSTKAASLTYLLLAPTVWTIIMFPQSVTFHPDLYDTLLAVGGPATLLFVVFSMLDEDRIPGHRFLPWFVTIMWGAMFHNIKQLLFFLKNPNF